MNITFRRLMGVLIAIAGAVPCAQGQQIPAVAEGDPIVHTTFTNNELQMVDVENNHAIILPNGLVFKDFAPGVVGQVQFQEQPTGCDIIYTFTNTGGQAARLGRLTIGKFNLGNNIFYRDFRHIGEPKQADYNAYAYQAFTYPHGIYSPVWTLYNDDYAVSVSLQYPIMTYKHDARVMLGSTPAEAPIEQGPRGWFVEFRLANIGNETELGRLVWPGTLLAGESRTYVVSVRVTRNPADWIRTLTPYRDYFRSMYGGVQYQRDPRPVHPMLMAVSHLISDENPYGFNYGSTRRPDRFGWRPWTDAIKAGGDDWKRVMLWAPSGLYHENRNLNYPYQFTTQWLAVDHMANVFDDDVGLPSLGRQGITLGLWWGRTVQVSRTWDSAQWESFDPDNPAHVQAAMAEMDLAVRAGATEIGLDTFNARYTPIWKLAPWLERMREAYPGVKFIIEPITCDILHRLGATFILGWANGEVHRESDLYRLNNPFYLADLLIPGHESWGAFSYHVHQANGYPVTPELIQQDMERFASLGYVPVMMSDPPSPRNVSAAESWLTTLPADVLRGSGWNTNFSTPMAHRQSDGRLVIVHDSGGAPPRPRQPNGRVGGATPDDPNHQAPVPGQPLNDDPESAPAEPAAPIGRPRHQINGTVRVQGGASRGVSPIQTVTIPRADDLPGARSMVTVPSNAAGKGRPGASKANGAWLEEMARKGMLDRARISQAMRKLHSAGAPGEPDVVVVPTDK